MTILSTKDISKKRNLTDWISADFWQLSLEKYRVSKRIRKVIKKNGSGFIFRELAKKLEVDRHYIYQVMMMNIKPSKDFLNKLNDYETN